MDIKAIISQLKTQFGDKIDVEKITSHLKGIDLSKISMPEIIGKLSSHGLLGSDKGNLADEIKGKAAGIMGGLFGK